MIGMNFTNPADFGNVPPEVGHIRLWDCGVHWAALHPAPGVFYWQPLDDILDRLTVRRHITYVFGGTPRWAAKYPDQPHFAPWLGPGSNSMPHTMAHFDEFVDAISDRYAGKIDAFEMWNEPQLAEFLWPYEDAQVNALATMVRRGYTIIKRNAPAARVIGPCVLPRKSSGGMTRARKFLAAMQRQDWHVDRMAAHLYPEVGHWAPRWGSMLTDVTSTLKALGAPGPDKVWITETTLGLLGDPLTDPVAIDRAVRGIYDAADTRYVYWYSWDRPDLGGLQIADGSPAWNAITRYA